MLLPGVGEKKPVLQYARVLFFKKACPEEKLVTQSLTCWSIAKPNLP